MDAPFPFGLPAPTGFYLTLYLLTLVLHVGLMNYVLAGTGYVAAVYLVSGKRAEQNPLAGVLADWLSFMLGATITAGVGPLLFLQILYRDAFYTANLLLSLRWLAVLPVLILGFYLLYLFKSRWAKRWPARLRGMVMLGTFASFFFVAWSFTENHLLSLAKEHWVEHYAAGAMLFHSAQLLPRLALWLVAAFPTMTVIAGWQLWYQHRRGLSTAKGGEPAVPGTRRTSMLGMGGIALTIAAAGFYYTLLNEPMREAIFSPLAFPYLVAVGLALAVQGACWMIQFAQSRLQARWLSIAAAALAIGLVGTSVVGESTRLAVIDIPAAARRHQDAMQIGGTWLFFAFLIINTALIAACIWLVRRGLAGKTD